MIAILAALLGIALILIIGASQTVKASNAAGCPPPPAPSPQILQMAQAIATAENSPVAWNNPGSLTASFGYPTSGTGNSAGVLMFTNCADGWNALYKQLSAIVNGQSRYTLSDTLTSMGIVYSGGDPNWAKNVGAALGVSPDTQLGDILA